MRDEHDLRSFHGITRLFPLPGVVMFPHVVLPLHVFEPRYRLMTEHALAGDRLITVVQLKPGADPWSRRAPIESVGCLGRIIQHERLTDGRFNILLLGLRRVRMSQELSVPLAYRQMFVRLIEEPEEIDSELAAAPARALLLAKLRELAGVSIDATGDALALGVLTDLLAHALPLPQDLKQALLNEPRAARRAAHLEQLLDRFAGPAPAPADRPRHFPPPFSNN
jgi:Lon protease-like protein